MSWESSIILKEGEKITNSWNGRRRIRTVSMPHDVQISEVKKFPLGILVLTNQRILWIDEKGLGKKSYHTVREILLENLTGVSMGGVWKFKYVSIAGNQGENHFMLKGIGDKEFEAFRKIILEQMEARKKELAEETKKGKVLVQVLLDFSFLKNYMEKGGLVMQTVKCPECKAPITLPVLGNQVKCEHCGSTILAQDIFDKVKELIG